MKDIFFHLSAADWSQIVQNYVVAGAAATTAWTAWSGVKAWKEQTLWKEDRQIAKRLIAEVTDLSVNARAMLDFIDFDKGYFYGKTAQAYQNDRLYLDNILAKYDNLRSEYLGRFSTFSSVVFEATHCFGKSDIPVFSPPFIKAVSGVYEAAEDISNALLMLQKQWTPGSSLPAHGRDAASFSESTIQELLDDLEETRSRLKVSIEPHLGRPS